MKQTTFLMILSILSLNANANFFGLFTGEKDVIRLELSGDTVVIKANLSKLEHKSHDDSWNIDLDNILPSVEGRESQELYLKAQFGWGDKPLNKICEEVGRMVGKPQIKFASVWGDQHKNFPLFKNPTFLVVGNNDTYEISNSEHNSGHYVKGISCSSEYYEY